MPTISTHMDNSSAAAEPQDLILAGLDYAENRAIKYEGALCAQSAPDVFFPEKGESSRNAKMICQSCPCRDMCLEDALEHDEQFGVWGGLSYPERRRLQRQREQGAA